METFLVRALQLILSLSILVVLHEYGHFFFARLFKVRVDKFYMFFNPTFSLFRAKKINGKWEMKFFSKNVPANERQKRNSEGALMEDEKGKPVVEPIPLNELEDGDWRKYPDNTEWGIGWLPLGGYCKIAGMVDESMDKAQMALEPQDWEYRAKPVWQRLPIIIGGVLVNFILAMVIYAGILFTWGQEYLPFENAKYGVHIEDSLYAATYDAFKANNLEAVKKNSELSKSRFPMGNNRDKFIFLDGLRRLNEGDAIGCINNMKDILNKYPKSGICEMAGMIVKGVNTGRKLHGGNIDIGDIWNRRSLAIENDSDKDTRKTFTNERETNFIFMLVYKADTLNENQLLYDIAKYNFSNFLVRNFDINIVDDGVLRRMEIDGFRNYDEALQYARKLYRDKPASKELYKCRSIIISESNLELLGKKFSYNDYDIFYEKYFAPLKITTQPLLIDPEPIDSDRQMQEQEIRQEKEQKEEKTQKNKDNFYDDLEKILNE